jgi:hypothetical protein
VLADFDLVMTEEFPDYKQARQREVYLKSGNGREWLDKVIRKSRPASGG